MSKEWYIGIVITVLLSIIAFFANIWYAKKDPRKILAEIRKQNEKRGVSNDEAKKIGEKIWDEIPEPSKDYSDNYEPEIRRNKEDTKEVIKTYSKTVESNTEIFEETNEGKKMSKKIWKSEKTKVVHIKK